MYNPPKNPLHSAPPTGTGRGGPHWGVLSPPITPWNGGYTTKPPGEGSIPLNPTHEFLRNTNIFYSINHTESFNMTYFSYTYVKNSWSVTKRSLLPPPPWTYMYPLKYYWHENDSGGHIGLLLIWLRISLNDMTILTSKVAQKTWFLGILIINPSHPPIMNS